MWKAANPALQTFRERVEQFLPIGLNKVWLRLDGDEEYELAGALGFTVEDYKNILRFGGFATADFKIRTYLMQRMIDVDIDTNVHYSRDAVNDKMTRETWIRFRNDSFAPYSSKLKFLTTEEQGSRPHDEARDDYIGDFYLRGGPRRSLYKYNHFNCS